MKDIEIIDQAMKKAQLAGWTEFNYQYARVFKQGAELMVEFLIDVDQPSLVVSYERVIFSPSWAEHFWGMDSMYFVVHLDQAPGMDNSVVGWKSEKELSAADAEWNYYDNVPAFEYHIQQLALEDTQTARVAYIQKFL